MKLLDQTHLKVAITGHTSGIGQAFADWFASRGHDIVGMSRSNGFDIGDTDRIIEHAQQCDVFINNAWQEFDQSKLMYQLHEKWFADQHKLIIAISSARTVKPVEYYDNDPARNLYKTSKHCLEESCIHLWNHNPFPRICLLKPGHVSTKFTEQSTRPKMPAQQFVEYFMSCLSSAPDDVFLQEICIREQHSVKHLRI